MRRVLRLVSTLFCLTSCEATDAPPEEARPDVEASAPAEAQSDVDAGAAAFLTPDGWGPLRIGSSREEVVAASGEDSNPEAVGGPDPTRCDEFHPSQAPEGMLVMIEGGTLTRISLINESEVKTEGGFGVGTLSSAIKAAHGSAVEVTPHAYLPAPAEYLTLWEAGPPGAPPGGVVYEVGPDGRVTQVRAGGPSIQYVEGCL